MEEHHINIEGTMNPRYQNILQSITEVGQVSPPVNPEFYIYRVHERLRKIKPEAYEPMVVSIGPYHLQNKKLQAMKKHKLWYLHSLIRRINVSLETYIQELGNLEDKVRECYDKPIHLNHEEFVEMMLLDSCFVIEFFRQKTDNPKLTVGWMKHRILDDMMLLENQLPFFLLFKLFEMTRNYDDPQEVEPLMFLMMKSFSERIQLTSLNLIAVDHEGIKHLLHLVHTLCRPLSRPNERNLNNIISDDIQNWDDIRNPMHSAVELQEAGVKFKKVGKYYNQTANILFDIKFEDGLMELPCFRVDDGTDTLFRNLIAFEQHSEDIVPKYISEYADFMDKLISSEKDVKLLRDEGIIVNFLGHDEEVSNLFNKLCEGVSVSYNLDSYYSYVRMKVNKHCKKTWNKMRAKLMRDYFNSPWASVSTIAAAVLLLLTLLQTIASIKTL